MANDSTISILQNALSTGRLTINQLEDGSGVVLDIDGEQLLTMNATGIAILQAVSEGASDQHTVAKALTDQFEVEPELARNDSMNFLRQVESYL